MQIQNTILPDLEMRAEKALQQGLVLVERMNRNAAGSTVAGRPQRADEVRRLIRADHATDDDRELLVTVHGPKHKRRVLQPRTTEQKVTHHPPVAQAFENVAQQDTERRSPARTVA